jgi:hypothetical protein
MRNMSFRLTTDQVRNQTKTVTRRVGWKGAKVGDIVQPVVKGQGLKKGEKVEKIGAPIRFVSVEREPLGRMLGREGEASREGFPMMSSIGFVNMFCEHNGCDPDDEITRIEFEYLEAIR